MNPGEREPLLRRARSQSTDITNSIEMSKGDKVKAVVGNYARNCCTLDSWKRRLPIITWVPKYRYGYYIIIFN